jgi:hypothetical protein
MVRVSIPRVVSSTAMLALTALRLLHVHHLNEAVDVRRAHIASRIGGWMRRVVAQRKVRVVPAYFAQLHERGAGCAVHLRAKFDGLAPVGISPRRAAGCILVGEVLGDDAEACGLDLHPTRGYAERLVQIEVVSHTARRQRPSTVRNRPRYLR